MNRLKLFTILVFTVLLSACATGSHAEKRSSSFGDSDHTFSCEGPITSIRAVGGLEVYYTQSKPGSRPSVIVDAGSDWDGLRLNQEGTVFTVTRNPKNRGTVHSTDVKIRISTPALNKVETGAGANFYISGGLKTDSELRLTASSGSEINIARLQTADNLTCDASSGATISLSNLSGATVALAGSSGSDINLNGKCRNISIVGTSGADIDVDAKVEKASISGSSAADVTLKGEVSGKAMASASSSANVDLGNLKTGSLQVDCTSGATMIIRDMSLNFSAIHTSSGGTITPVTSVKGSDRGKNNYTIENYTIEETVEENEEPVERTQPIKP